jgi:hypothetical protein
MWDGMHVQHEWGKMLVRLSCGSNSFGAPRDKLR